MKPCHTWHLLDCLTFLRHHAGTHRWLSAKKAYRGHWQGQNVLFQSWQAITLTSIYRRLQVRAVERVHCRPKLVHTTALHSTAPDLHLPCHSCMP